MSAERNPPFTAESVVYFGPEDVLAPDLRVCRTSAGVVDAAESGALRALVLDARSADSFFRAMELLRALFDDPRRTRPGLDPRRILALIGTGDVDAAFGFGRFGIDSVIEERCIDELEPRLGRILLSEGDQSRPAVPLHAPARARMLVAPAPGEDPIVAIAYRHAPETLRALERYQSALRSCAAESTVFADVATLVDVMVKEDLTLQTNLATKAGITVDGQFIGSFEFYRQLRRTRYRHIPEHPRHEIAMDVFITVDEIIHEVLHLLFLANARRAGLEHRHFRVAEEVSVTWWQAVVHQRAFPDWLADEQLLRMNDDFLLVEGNQASREFWTRGCVFDPYADFPWVSHVLSRLPERASYIGERPDLAALRVALEHRPEARFLDARWSDLAVRAPFDAYPEVPPTLRVGR